MFYRIIFFSWKPWHVVSGFFDEYKVLKNSIYLFETEMFESF